MRQTARSTKTTYRYGTGVHQLLVLALLLAPALATAKPYEFLDKGWLAPASALPNWQAALTRNETQRGEFAACLAEESLCTGADRSLRYLLNKAQGLSRPKKVSLVNAYINRRRYRTDRSSIDVQSLEPGQRLRTHWSTLFEFLQRGGDCEDYASAKYFLLRELGFTADELRVVVTFDPQIRGHHAVVALHQPNNKAWLLDMDKIHRNRHSGYQYRYAVNEKSIWDHATDASPTITTGE